jgi:hypothetical protein
MIIRTEDLLAICTGEEFGVIPDRLDGARAAIS